MIKQAEGHCGSALAKRASVVVCCVPVLLILAATWTFSQAKEKTEGLAWQLPGKLSIYDLQFGPAVVKDDTWTFSSHSRTYNVSNFPNRLALMIRFHYNGSRSGLPVRFIIRLPHTREFEETVHLRDRRGQYAYRFTIHRPEEFIGTGAVLVYHGLSLVDVLEFTILKDT